MSYFSPTTRLFLVLSMIVAGICVAVQGPVNARLRLAVGSPVFSATFSFFSGALVLFSVMATGLFGGSGSGLRGLQIAPPWAFLGGVLGATYVLGSINAAGGKLDPSARGVDEDEYLPAAKLGVTKINIDTDGRLVWTRVHREFFRDHPEMFDFRPPGKTFVAEYSKFIANKNQMLGSAHQLPEVRKALAG